jgi:Protein of unknown function (DUF2914)/Tetratricopeptide repeat
MADVLEPAPLVEGAQQAAAAGDYPEAERLLREAAAIQEVSLGSLHPDLASTLNNLALVCERTNKFDEAERGYRRAHAIAVASLSPGHPFISTSLANLVDFCAAHEIPLWKSPARADDGISSPSPEPEADVQAEPVLPVYTPGRTWPPRTIALTTVGVVAVVALVFAARGRGTTDAPDPLPEAATMSSASDSGATSATAPALTGEPQPAVTLETRADTTPAPVEGPNPPETSVTTASVSVLTAQLCSALERTGSPDWQCAPMNGDLQPGTYIFYTRLLTDVDTTVEHRWYQGERMHQVRRLRVTASPGNGYRTFSSNTISPERAGNWKVELRGADGTVLREEHFVVR